MTVTTELVLAILILRQWNRIWGFFSRATRPAGATSDAATQTDPEPTGLPATAAQEIFREQQVAPSVQTVFNIPLLMNKILDFALSDGDNVCMKTANNCKKVSRYWLEMVSHSLQRSLPSRKHLHVYGDYILRFCSTFQYSPVNRIPPFVLYISLPDDLVFVSSLCLVGAGMVQLKLCINCRKWNSPRQSNFLQCIPKPLQLHLPQLKEFVLYLKCKAKGNCLEMHKIGRTLCASILAGSESLRSFTVRNWFSEFVASDVLLGLPKSVTYVKFDCLFKANEMASLLLGNYTLANLSSLTLRIPDTLDITDELGRILRHYCHQFKKLDILTDEDGDLNLYDEQLMAEMEMTVDMVNIVMPVMVCLEEFVCTAGNYQWADDDDCSNVVARFPALQKIKLRNQTSANLRKWFQSASCPTVEQVETNLIPDPVVNDDIDALFMEQLHGLKLSFQNITKLKLFTTFTPEMLYLKVVFQEMRQLQYLNIIFYEVPKDAHHVFNGLIIGISPEEAAALEYEQNDSNRNLDYEGLPSIVHMTELKTFKMSSVYFKWPVNNISDVAFEYAFLKMPKLRELKLRGGFDFRPSPEMARRWKDHCQALDIDFNIFIN